MMNPVAKAALAGFECALADILGQGSAHHILSQRELEKLKAALESKTSPKKEEKENGNHVP
jgi:hypothetical protein